MSPAFLHHTLASIQPNGSRYTRAAPRRGSDLMPVFSGVQALFFTTYFPKLISWSCGSLELQSYYTRSRGHAPRGEEKRREERTNRLSSLPRRRTGQGQGSRPGCQKLQSTLLGRRTNLLSASEVFPACSSTAPSCSSLCLFPPPPSGGGGLLFFTNTDRKEAFFRTQKVSQCLLHILGASAHFFPQTYFFLFILLTVLLLHPFFTVLLYSVSEEMSYNRDAHLIRPEEFSHGCRAARGVRTKKIRSMMRQLYLWT